MPSPTRAVAPAPLHLKLEHFSNMAGFSAIDITNGYTVAMTTYTPFAMSNVPQQDLDGLAALMTAAPQLAQALANVIDLAEAGLKCGEITPTDQQEKELQLFDATLLMRRLGIRRGVTGN